MAEVEFAARGVDAPVDTEALASADPLLREFCRDDFCHSTCEEVVGLHGESVAERRAPPSDGRDPSGLARCEVACIRRDSPPGSPSTAPAVGPVDKHWATIGRIPCNSLCTTLTLPSPRPNGYASGRATAVGGADTGCFFLPVC